MNYQCTSAGSQKTMKGRKRVYNSNCEELEHVRKVCRERLYWEKVGRGKAPQERILMNWGELLHCRPMRGGMDWWHALPDPPKYINMAPQMSYRHHRIIQMSYRNTQPLHSYSQYAPCYLNHPPTPRVAPKQMVNMGRPNRPAQCPKPVPAGHQTPQVNIDHLLSKLLSAGVIKIPQVPPPEKSLSQKNIDDLLSNLLSAGVIKIPPNDSADKSEEKAPDLRDFSKTKLKRRYENIIRELYMGTQCSKCTMRFKQWDQYIKHMDSHKKQSHLTPSKSIPHSWYSSVNDWLKYDLEESVKEAVSSEDSEEPDSQHI